MSFTSCLLTEALAWYQHAHLNQLKLWGGEWNQQVLIQQSYKKQKNRGRCFKMTIGCSFFSGRSILKNNILIQAKLYMHASFLKICMDMMHFNHHCMSPGLLEAKLAGSTSIGRTRWRRRARFGVGPKVSMCRRGRVEPLPRSSRLEMVYQDCILKWIRIV